MDPRKLAKLNINDFIKDGSPARLQSLRLPRDLSLGGTKCKKKQLYKPNVNVVRNKFKLASEKKSEKVKPKKEKEFNKHRFVQSAGVFSQGINSVKIQEKLLKSTEKETSMPPEPSPCIRKEKRVPCERREATIVQEIKNIEDSDNDTVDSGWPTFQAGTLQI